MKYDSNKKCWTMILKLKPGKYTYKYFVENEWVLTKSAEVEADMNNNENHVIVVD